MKLTISLLFLSLLPAACTRDANPSNGEDRADEAGGSERSAIIGALHEVIDAQVNGQANEFVVDHFVTEEKFAFVTAAIQKPGGGDLDWTNSAWAQDAEDGLFDGPSLQALLHFSNGAWSVAEYGVGATDVWWSGLWNRYPTKTCSLYPFADETCLDVAEPPRQKSVRNGIVKSIHAEFDKAFHDQPNELVFSHLQATSRHAFALGHVQGQNGTELDLQDSEYAELIAEGLFDGPFFSAYLELVDDEWELVFSDMGATDVSWFGLWNNNEAPCGIYPVQRCD